MRLRFALAICGLFLLVIFSSGCETFKGAAEGFSLDWQSAKENVQKMDSWIRENLW